MTVDLRRCVLDMAEYQPPDDIERLAREIGVSPEQIIKLDANENAYGCSPRVAEALARFQRSHLYPDPSQTELQEAVADYAGVHPDQLMFGNGSDELIDLLMRAILDPGDELVDFSPTFAMYAFAAQQFAVRVVEVPRDEAFDLDVDAAVHAIGPRSKMAFVAAPNNPTGNPVERADLERLLDTGRVVVSDEAYTEFWGTTFTPLVRERENLIVLRTFSKWAGLAGLRIGYAVLPSSIAPHLWKLKQPFNVNAAAVEAVKASLQDLPYLHANVAKIVEERERMFAALEAIPYLRPYPSQGNFVLCRVIDRDAQGLRDALAKRGILVRHYTHPRIRDCLRISVGLPKDTDALVAALKES